MAAFAVLSEKNADRTGGAGSGTASYAIMEVSGISEPLPIALSLSRTNPVASSQTLLSWTPWSQCVTSTFMKELQTLESLRSRNWHVDAEDERTGAPFLRPN